MEINKNNIIRLCLVIVDTRPKNKYIVNHKSPYKKYICNQYES